MKCVWNSALSSSQWMLNSHAGERSNQDHFLRGLFWAESRVTPTPSGSACPHMLHQTWKLTDSQLPSSVGTCPCWQGQRNTRWSGWTASVSAAFLWPLKGCFPLGQEAWLEWGQYDKPVWGLSPIHQGAKQNQILRELESNLTILPCIQKQTLHFISSPSKKL